MHISSYYKDEQKGGEPVHWLKWSEKKVLLKKHSFSGIVIAIFQEPSQKRIDGKEKYDSHCAIPG